MIFIIPLIIIYVLMQRYKEMHANDGIQDKLDRDHAKVQ